jgi:hypothetical protein
VQFDSGFQQTHRKIVADARCRLVACCPFPRRRGSAVAQEKRLIDPMLPGSLNPKPLPPLKKPGRAVDAGQRAVRAQIDAVSGVAALDRRRFRRLPRRRRVAADHWTDLASHAAVA